MLSSGKLYLSVFLRSSSDLPLIGSTHLNDLKSITEDVLYETYRTEKLSRGPDSSIRDSQILPSELATQSVRIKEEQLRREEEKVPLNTDSSFVLLTESFLLAARNRGQGAKRNQREEARTVGEGGCSKVCVPFTF